MAGFFSKNRFENSGGSFGSGSSQSSFGGNGGFGSGNSQGGFGGGGGFGSGSSQGGFGSNGGFGSGSSQGGFGGNGGFGSGSSQGGFGGGGGFGGSKGGPSFPTSPVSTVGKRKPFRLALIVTLIYGALWFFLGELLEKALFNKIWNPLAMAVYVVVFLLPLLLLLLLMSRITGNMDSTFKIWGSGKTLGVIALCLLITFMATLVLEFLYEIGGSIQDYSPTSYVFVIDDSGSMSSNDPSMLRADAIGEIMKEEDIPYCVYKFSGDAELIREIGDYQDGDAYEFTSDGSDTNILQALYTVAQDLKDTSFQGGPNPKVLLLSDGESYSDYLEEVMKEYTDQNVSISTVGFGSVNKSLMGKIAKMTGGVFIHCDDISTLKEDMHQAMISHTTRTLLTPRYVTRNNVLYLILRILFLAMIAAMIGMTKARGAVSDYDFMSIFVSASAQGFVAAVLCEILVNPFEGLARFLVNILWAVTIMTQQDLSFDFPGGSTGGTNTVNQGSRSSHTKTVGAGNNNWGSSGSGNMGWNNTGSNGNWSGFSSSGNSF